MDYWVVFYISPIETQSNVQFSLHTMQYVSVQLGCLIENVFQIYSFL